MSGILFKEHMAGNIHLHVKYKYVIGCEISGPDFPIITSVILWYSWIQCFVDKTTRVPC